jgi:cellulose synthase/poly-beta-1,6-N-acetylglucosamine synthase-like glycosyltransferase
MWNILIILILVECILPFYYLCMKHLSIKDNGVAKKYWEPSVSIIIPTFNEETTIISKLKNIAELNYPIDKLELFIVDGCSTDKTIKHINTFQNSYTKLNLEFIQEKDHGGKVRAVNAVVPLCKGELICISDSDCIWDKDALKEAVANFSDDKVGAVTGLQILMVKDAIAEKVEHHYNGFYNTLRLGESVLDSVPIFRGELTIVRGNLFKKIEVGTESAWADDSEIAMKIRKLGYRTIVDPKAIFYEFAPPTLDSRKKQKSRRGLGLIRLFLNNWKIIISPHRYGTYSLICAANLFYLTISPILVFLIPIIFIWLLSMYSIEILSYLISIFVGILLIQYILFGNKIGQFTYSFLQSQFILLISLPYITSKDTKWSQITEIRDRWREKTGE